MKVDKSKFVLRSDGGLKGTDYFVVFVNFGKPTPEVTRNVISGESQND